MKKVRFSIIQQVIISILLIAIFPVFEGFCIYASFNEIEGISNSFIAARVVSSFLQNPIFDKRVKDSEEMCLQIAKNFANRLSFCSRSDMDDIYEESVFPDFVGGYAEGIYKALPNSNNVRIRVIGNNKKLLADNAHLLTDENFFYKEDERVRNSLISDEEYRKLSKNFMLEDCWYVNHDYYDGYYYSSETYDGEEIKKALKEEPCIKYRISLDDKEASKIYAAVPFYIDGDLYGAVLVSKTFFTIISTKKEWAYLLGSFCILSLFVSFPFIVFLICRLSWPVKKLSEATLSHAVMKGEFDFIELPYEKRNDEIGDLSKSFSILLRKLKHSIEYLESYSSDVTHELKNPITSICMNAEFMTLEKLSVEEYSETGKKILADAKRLNVLLADMRENAKLENQIESNKDIEKVNIVEFLKNLLLTFSNSNQDKDIKLYSDNEEYYINAKLSNLERLFINLIDNAIGFGKEVLISINEVKNKKELIITVEDSGPGIPLEEREKIFKRFYSNRKKALEKSHSGLGLSNVKSIVYSMGGTIEVSDSKKLGGACFSIVLPINIF